MFHHEDGLIFQQKIFGSTDKHVIKREIQVVQGLSQKLQNVVASLEVPKPDET